MQGFLLIAWATMDKLHGKNCISHSFQIQILYSGSDGRVCLQCRRHKRCGFNPWVGKIPWRRTWQPTPVFLPGKSHGQRNLAGYGPWCHKESDRTLWHNSSNMIMLLFGSHPGLYLEAYFPFPLAEILSVFPETGSLGGRTDITITGDFFDNPAQVTIAGKLKWLKRVHRLEHCRILYIYLFWPGEGGGEAIFASSDSSWDPVSWSLSYVWLRLGKGGDFGPAALQTCNRNRMSCCRYTHKSEQVPLVSPSGEGREART